jgi:hypothetical protein
MSGPTHHGPQADRQEHFDRVDRALFDATPLCERCKKRPPTDILRYTAFRAVCRECRDFILDSIERTIQEINREREEDDR